ncbi:hypothetical protein JCM10213v2_002926 [Rhodosporidiobolus nylandii]
MQRRHTREGSRYLRTKGTPLDRDEGARDGLDTDDGEVDLYMLCWGYALVVSSAMCFFVGVWSILIGPLTDTSGLGLLDTIAKDTYYKFLAVLFIPVTVCFVIVNWWGLKIFRHA